MHASFLSHKLRVGLLALAVAALATIVSASASAANTPGTADLQLSLSAVTHASVGDSIAYVLQVRNAGPERATTVRVSLELASQASFVSAASSQGACSPTSSAAGNAASGATATGANTATGATVNQPAPVQCLVGPLGPGEHARVTVTARVNAAGTFSGRATVSADQPDPNAQNNAAELTTTAANTASGGADLRLSLSAPANARVDHSIHYVARVVNRGPQTATSVKFADQLAGAARIVRVGASRGTCVGAAANAAGSSTSVTCSVGHLRRGAEARFDVVVQATAAGSVTNTASVSSDVADSDTGNNSTQATTNVVAAPAPVPTPQPVVAGPNLRVDLAGPRHAKGGALIRYVAQVRNRGNVDATSTTLSLDVARSVVKVFSITTSQGTCSASATATGAATVTAAGANSTTATGASLNTPTGKVPRVPTAAVAGCSLGTLAPGARARVVFVIRAHSRGKIVVTASVSADGTDTRLANNHASLTTQLNRHPQAVGKHAHRNDGAGHAKKASGEKDKD